MDSYSTDYYDVSYPGLILQVGVAECRSDRLKNTTDLINDNTNQISTL